VLATADAGFVAFNGRSFRQISPGNSGARAITAILPSASGHLLFGTKKRGVLMYDGKHIRVLHPTLDGIYVTALSGTETDLWIGTLDRGVLHFHAGVTDGFSEAQGLPDRQVLSLSISGETTYVGTATGVAVLQSGRFSRVLAEGVMASALLGTPQELYVGTQEQGVIAIPLAGRRPIPGLAPSQQPPVRDLFVSEGQVYALAGNGLFRFQTDSYGWQQVLGSSTGVLTDRNVSALAADDRGHIWIGYFDRGLDVLSPDGRVSHKEDEHVFCVNRIFPDAKSGTVDVATANGLVRFDNAGNEQQVLTRADGLIADHVTDIAAYRDGLAVATPAGLTFIDATGARSMYAFHGLVNNHVYALGVSGDALLAGTLGGISRLEKGSVVVNYTTTSSNLKHNWITAVVPVGDEWMVGTYGAGVLSLDHEGRFHAFEGGTGKFEVNPNAMLVTPRYVLVGTLGEGVFVFDRQAERWSAIRDGLPSLNVTAFASAGGYVYVGTDNGLERIPEQKLHI